MSKEKKFWQINTITLAQRIKDAAAIAKNTNKEEDLKMRVEPLLQKAFKQLGIDIDIVRYEKSSTSYKGRQDAVYGYLTIEYKLPSTLGTKRGVQKTTQQLQKYLKGQAMEHGKQQEEFLEKAVGVAIDGERIMFIRFSKTAVFLDTPIPVEKTQAILFPTTRAVRGFQRSGPFPINRSSLNNLLIFIRAAARRPLTARDLADVFGPQCPIAQQAVSELYSAVIRAQRRQQPSRIKTFFTEWDRIFGVVYGQNLDKAEKAAAETARVYQLPAGSRLKQLLFAIHTYYAFLMKIIAYELVAMQRERTVTSFIRDCAPLDDEKLYETLTRLESGLDFINQGIENFLEADFFSWYLDVWDTTCANAFRNIVRAFADFEPATPVLEPEWTKDLLQKLYEILVPRKLRHDLGEYYTPDWLAGYLVDKSGYKGNPGTRFLDPACGSGTFLVQAIHRIMSNIKKRQSVQVTEIARHILDNVVGFDLNPLAVLAARTNYLIAFSKFIPFIRPIIIPVYLCDSILAPSRYEEEGKLPFDKDTLVFTTTKGDYIFPVCMQSKQYVDTFTSLIDIAIKSKLISAQFKKTLTKEFKLPEQDIDLLLKIYERIKHLDESGENGIWARYIKNAFAPVYVGKFDYVIGNPPWIRWDYLSDDYRNKTLKLWHKYGLFSLKGYETRLGGGKKDFSMLFTYTCADNYLKKNGKLGFVITIEVFKSKGAGEGFRKFELKNTRDALKILRMEDMVDLQPFQAANKTSIFILQKGKKTKYPVPVIKWQRKKGIGRMKPEWYLDEVLTKSKRQKLDAVPVNPDRMQSSWQTASVVNLQIYSQLKGNNNYKPHTGAFTTPYGVFWLKVKQVRPDNVIVIENMHNRGKWKVNSVSAAIEPELVFPAITSGDITAFGIKSYFHLLISQDPKKRQGYDENYLMTKLPLTYAYLKQFEDVLVKRAAYRKYFCQELSENNKPPVYKPIAPFYSQFDISTLTFARYRTTWKQMGTQMIATVLSSVKTDYGIKPMISTHTTAFFAVDNKQEAHYLCAILNSSIVNAYIKSFSAAGRGFGTPSVMNNLAIPKFDPRNNIHIRLAALSEKAHAYVKAKRDIEAIEEEIDVYANKLWNIKQ
jgi:SAM-dependent methyltransferase